MKKIYCLIICSLLVGCGVRTEVPSKITNNTHFIKFCQTSFEEFIWGESRVVPAHCDCSRNFLIDRNRVNQLYKVRYFTVMVLEDNSEVCIRANYEKLVDAIAKAQYAKRKKRI